MALSLALRRASSGHGSRLQVGRGKTMEVRCCQVGPRTFWTIWQTCWVAFAFPSDSYKVCSKVVCLLGVKGVEKGEILSKGAGDVVEHVDREAWPPHRSGWLRPVPVLPATFCCNNWHKCIRQQKVVGVALQLLDNPDGGVGNLEPLEQEQVGVLAKPPCQPRIRNHHWLQVGLLAELTENLPGRRGSSSVPLCH
jgi:hypothetical protein